MKHEMLTWRQRGMLWFRLVIRFILVLFAAILFHQFGGALLTLFAPFLLALAAAVVLNPAVRWLQHSLGWSRQFSCLVLMILLFGLVGTALFLLLYAAGKEVMDLAQNWDMLLPAMQSVLGEMDALFYRLLTVLPGDMIELVQESARSLLEWFNKVIPDAMTGLIQTMGNKVANAPSFVVALLMFLMGMFFITADYPYLRTKVIQSMDEDVLHFWGQLRATALGAFGGYLKAQMLLSIGVFFILLVGFTLIGQSYSLLLAFGLAVLDFIPLLGAGTVMIPWAIISLLLNDYERAISLILIWGVIALFRRVAEPKFVGDQTGLSPILSLISIYVGMKIGGVLGMIFGPILLLIGINLAGMGLFDGIFHDVRDAVRDLMAILSQRIDPT